MLTGCLFASDSRAVAPRDCGSCCKIEKLFSNLQYRDVQLEKILVRYALSVKREKKKVWLY